jgi:hypothetical protein
VPTDLAAALQALLGHSATIVADGGTFTGTVAGVTNNLVIMAANGGVVYIRPADITAVSTNGLQG